MVWADERLSLPRTVGLGAQHVVAMFGAGRPRQGGEGAAIIIDEPGAYKEP